MYVSSQSLHDCITNKWNISGRFCQVSMVIKCHCTKTLKQHYYGAEIELEDLKVPAKSMVLWLQN